MFDFKREDFSTKATSQSHPIPGTNQVPNWRNSRVAAR